MCADHLPGKGRLSQARRRPVPLALAGVTVLCGMGSSGAPPLDSPGKGNDRLRADTRDPGNGNREGWSGAHLACARRRSAHGLGVKSLGRWVTGPLQRLPAVHAQPRLPGTLPGAYISYERRGLILRTASRLDAVSAYPDPT